MDYYVAEGIQEKSPMKKGLNEAIDDLEKNVAEMMKEGWVPQGGITVHEYNVMGHTMIHLLQPMIIYDDDD